MIRIPGPVRRQRQPPNAVSGHAPGYFGTPRARKYRDGIRGSRRSRPGASLSSPNSLERAEHPAAVRMRIKDFLAAAGHVVDDQPGATLEADAALVGHPPSRRGRPSARRDARGPTRGRRSPGSRRGGELAGPCTETSRSRAAWWSSRTFTITARCESVRCRKSKCSSCRPARSPPAWASLACQ